VCEKAVWKKGREKDIFGDEFEIYVANKRKLKVLTTKKELRAQYRIGVHCSMRE
jgi:hypothetical protein